VALAWTCWEDGELDEDVGNDEDASDTTTNPGEQFKVDELDF
jgi:hypothetical protein